MSKSEFILLILGILYGVALVDLLKIIRHKNHYWESIVWLVILFLVVIADWFRLYNFVDIISQDIFLFTLYILTPLIFVQVYFTLTPEDENQSMKDYFLQTRKQFFTTIIIYLISKILLQYYIHDDGKLFLRVLGISLYTICIFWDKVWIRLIPVSVTCVAIYQTFILKW